MFRTPASTAGRQPSRSARIVRSVLAVAVAGAALVGIQASAAAAATSPSPSPSASPYACEKTDDTYSRGGVCALTVVKAAPACVADVPVLDYELLAEGTPHTTATVTWVNPDGADVVLTGQPLSGRLLWPGAAVDAQGKATDWPGWKKSAAGTWVSDSSDAWAAGTVTVLFSVNPQATVKVAYPAATAACVAPTGRGAVLAAGEVQTVSARGAVLAATGADIALGVGIAAGLAGLGVLFIVLRTRGARRHHGSHTA